jgi:hypothetical protein
MLAPALVGLGALAAAQGSGDPGAAAAAFVVDPAPPRFSHFNGRSGRRYIVEIMGSGVALLDYDGDGDLDVLLLDGAPIDGAPVPEERMGTRLFRNDGAGGFEDATAGSGLGDVGHAMGAAVGDVDADGDPDLLVTAYGRDALYRNEAGRFRDVTEEAGVGDERWTTSAAFLDYDADGDLDLYVAGYVAFDPERFQPCLLREREIYCGPAGYPGIPDRLYENDGSGRFRDVSAATGVGAHSGKGLGVVAGDLDGDGDQDVYVANDGVANLLLVNQLDAGAASFRDEGVALAAAFGLDGKAEGGMGTDAGDVDGDGDLELVCTNLDTQTTSLYRNDGSFGFLETSFTIGLGAATLPLVGFGVRFVDYDADGDLDLIETNGHIMDNVADIHQWGEFAQRLQLFENREGRFVEVCADCLPKLVGRGLATGDLDGDGDEDAIVTSNDGAPLLLRNVAPRAGGVVGLRLEGAPPGSNRDAYGARVRWSVGGSVRVREVHAAGSYLSSSDPGLLLAAGDRRELEVEIVWPSGRVESVTLEAGAWHRVREGEGVRERTRFREPR